MSGFGNRYISGLRWSLGSIYMESYFIDARTFDGVFQPKNTVYETINTQDITEFKDTLILSDIPNSRLEDDKSHAIPGGIGDKRSLVWLPLMSTGLLRRAIQALIGRANPGYVIPNNQDLDNYGEQSPINISTSATVIHMAYGVNITPTGNFASNMEALTHTLGRSRGLFRTENYDYYFISIQSPNVFAYQCTFGSSGKILIRYLKAYLAGEGKPGVILSDDDLLKLESYILSDISIEIDTRFLVGTITVVGGSIFNGWHFNKDGSKADIISMERIYNTDEVPKDLYITARHYQIEFSVNSEFQEDQPIGDDNSPISLILSTIEETNCTPRNNKDNVWYPMYSLGNMAYYYWCTNSGGFLTDMTEYDAPIYCMYDNNDVLMVSRVYYEELELPSYLPLNEFYASVYTCSDGTIEETSYALDSYTHSGFYILNGDDHRLYDKTGIKRYAKAIRQMTADVYVLNRSGASPYSRTITSNLCGNNPDRWWSGLGAHTITRHGCEAWGERCSSVTWTETNDYIFIVPWFDAESFYCGNTVSSADTGTHYHDYRKGIGTEEVVFTSGPDIGKSALYTQPADSYGQLPAGGGLPVDESHNPQVEGQQSFIASLNLYYKCNSLLATEHSYSENVYNAGLLVTNMGRWSSLIDPILFGSDAYPFFDLPYLVNQGLLDNIIYFTDPDSNTWAEGFRQRNIIGLTDEILLDVYQLGIFSGWT